MSNKKDIKKFLNKISLKAASNQNSSEDENIVGYITYGLKSVFEEDLELDPYADLDRVNGENSAELNELADKIDNLMQEGVEDRDIVNSLSEEEVDLINEFLSRFLMVDISNGEIELIDNTKNPVPQQVQGQVLDEQLNSNPKYSKTGTNCIMCLFQQGLTGKIREQLIQSHELLNCVLRKANPFFGFGKGRINIFGVNCLKLIINWRKLYPNSNPRSADGAVKQCFLELDRIIKEITGRLTGEIKNIKGLKVMITSIKVGSQNACVITISCDGASKSIVVVCRSGPKDPVILEPLRVVERDRVADLIRNLKERLRKIQDVLNNPPAPLAWTQECVLLLPTCSVEVAEAIGAGFTTVGLCALGGASIIAGGAVVAATATGAAVCGVATADGNIGDIDEQGNVIAPLEWVQEQCNLLQDLQGPGDDLDLSVCEREYLCDINPDCCGPITSPECIDLIPMAEENCQDGGEGPGMG